MNQKYFFIFFICLSRSFFIISEQRLPQTSSLINTITPLNIEQPPLQKGSLTVICGSMCAGKSEELIKQIGRLILAGFNVLIFKPAIDNRKILNIDEAHVKSDCYIPSRSGSWIQCIPVSSVSEMKKIISENNAPIIAIDEVHFFTPETNDFFQLIKDLVFSGKKIILSGLELDFRAEPFGPMPNLLAFADNVLKLKAICSICGDDTYCLTQRIIDGVPAHYHDPLILVGSSQYEPRCRKCHIVRKD